VVFGVLTGTRRVCDIHNEFAVTIERYFRDPNHKPPYKEEEIEAWMTIIVSSHNVGHYHRARYEQTALRSVMGAFKDAMKREPAE
jgi:hypothetical protein